MPNSKLGFYLRSPLVRHPTLLVRKIRERTGTLRPFSFTPPPSGFTWTTNGEVGNKIRAWATLCDINPHHCSPDVVFGHPFQHQDLLNRCRDGMTAGVGLAHDIKVPWEFSRFYTLPLRALSTDHGSAQSHSRQLADEISEWLLVCCDADGPMWTNPMEVAIRAINWMVADDLLHGELRRALGEDAWKTTMWHHGRAIEARLEAKLVSSNHYLANLLGLLFIGNHAGYAPWFDFAAREFPAAVIAQSFPDGGAYEASLPYHALITEMALLFLLTSEAHATEPFRHHVARMVQIVADTNRAGGDVFPVGDDDSGRVIAIDHGMKQPGRGNALLHLAGLLFGQPPKANATSSLYPSSGWWNGKTEHWHAHLEFGGVGFAGKGGHAHNDTLSLCVDWNGIPLLIDPGSHLYTGSPATRNHFRSTAMHNVVVFDDREQIPLGGHSARELFSLPGPCRASRVVTSSPNEISVQARIGLATHRRTVELRDGDITVTDVFSGAAHRSASLCLHIAHGISTRQLNPTTFSLATEKSGVVNLTIDAVGEAVITQTHSAPRYGNLLSSTHLVIRFQSNPPRQWTWKLSPC